MADADISGLEFLIAIAGYVAIMAGVGTVVGLVAGWIVGKVIDIIKIIKARRARNDAGNNRRF